MTGVGPTQGAERHAATLQEGWTARPRLATFLRILIFALPLLGSFGFSIAAGRIAPASELGMNRWLWILTVFLLANVLLFVMRRLTARLIPLVALMKLTLVFPDNAPSRIKSALRTSNSRTMLRSMRVAQANGETTGEALNGDYLVQLLRDVNHHDRLTRGHSERVRAYSELLGVEIGLDEEDLNKLRWAALLHDVGKLTVPSEILNKNGRPTDEEWKILSNHPAAGMPLLEPLRDWLGDWVHAADQHHCRWDGGGYPTKLAGTDITLAGRLVAIADAYDVMTSTRSYKKPFSPEVARQELTDCAGGQFDPTLVRAFLQVGLGRLKSVAGPLAWISNLTGSAQLPLPAANVVWSGTLSAGVAATGVVTVAVASVYSPSPPEAIAMDAPAVVAEDVTVDAVAGGGVEVLLTASGDALTFTVGGAAHGDVALVAFPQLVDGDTLRWQAVATYTATENYVGEDGFGFEACAPDGECDQGAARIQLRASAPAPTTAAPATTERPVTTTAPQSTASTTTSRPATTVRPTTTTVAPTVPVTRPEVNLGPVVGDDIGEVIEDQVLDLLVMSNDVDPEGRRLSIGGVGAPIHGTAMASGDGIRYEPPLDFFGTDQFTYTVSDGVNPAAVGTVVISVLPVNDAPRVTVASSVVREDTEVGSFVSSAIVVDPDDTDFDFTLTGDPTNRFSVDEAGVIRLAAPLDYESAALHDVDIRVSDGKTATIESVQIVAADVDEAPVAAADIVTTAEDIPVDFDVLANDVDPEGQTLTSSLPAETAQGGTLTEEDGLVRYVPPTDFEGTDTFSYQAKDPELNSSGDTVVTIDVTAANDAPIVADDGGIGFTTSEDTAFTTANVRTNDSDVDDAIETSTVEVLTDVTSGTLTDNGDGTFDYLPDADRFGPDFFQYKLVDASGAVSSMATVTIDVAAVNDAPVANDDALTVVSGGSAVSVDLRLNDLDVDDTDLLVTAKTDGLSGTVVLNDDGTVTYSHDGTSSTSDSFTYTVSDPSGSEAVATVSVTVTPIFDGDGVGVDDNCPAVYNPTQIDTDLDGVGDACDVTQTTPSDAELGPSVALGVADSQALDAADFDGDGDPDVVFANLGAPNTIFRNDFPIFGSTGQSLGSEDTRNVAIGDIDGDGDFDLVFADGEDDNTSWINNGNGFFTQGATLAENREAWDVALGDIDGDGDMDAVFANIDGDSNTVWWGDGNGNFGNSGQTLGSSDSKGVEMGDLNGDGSLDLTFSNSGDADTIWFNDGNGIFTNSGQSLGVANGQSHASRLADLDRDGDLDMVIAGDNEGDTIWLNNGVGVFSRKGPILGFGHSRGLDVGDIDGDGDLDIVFADHVNGSSIWLNNGSAAFAYVGEITTPADTEDVLLIDIDGDGEFGLIEANDDNSNQLYDIG